MTREGKRVKVAESASQEEGVKGRWEEVRIWEVTARVLAKKNKRH